MRLSCFLSCLFFLFRLRQGHEYVPWNSDPFARVARSRLLDLLTHCGHFDFCEFILLGGPLSEVSDCSDFEASEHLVSDLRVVTD